MLTAQIATLKRENERLKESIIENSRLENTPLYPYKPCELFNSCIGKEVNAIIDGHEMTGILESIEESKGIFIVNFKNNECIIGLNVSISVIK